MVALVMTNWLDIMPHLALCRDCKPKDPIELVFWHIGYGSICLACAQRRGLVW